MGCLECNSTELVENHHVIPKADGGVDETIPLCRSCHLRLHGINGDFRRWTSAWHQYYREVDLEGYREHQRNAGKARQAQLRRLFGENGYSAYQRRLALRRWENRLLRRSVTRLCSRLQRDGVFVVSFKRGSVRFANLSLRLMATALSTPTSPAKRRKYCIANE